MRINQVVLIPGIAAIGNEGQISGRFSEKEAIHGYLDAVLEHMEEDRIQVKVLDPLDPIQPNTLLIHCLLGWEKPNSKAKSNMATIGYVGQEAVPLAAMLCESLSEWGRSYVDYHHKTANPKAEIGLDYTNTPGTISAVIRPFKLNGVEAEFYMRNLSTLGRTIAYCVHEFLLGRGEQAKFA